MAREFEIPLSRTAGEGGERSEPGEGLKIQESDGPLGLIGRARALRRNSTDTERRLWSALRDRRLSGCKFRRQVPIGSFIADFACTKYLLIVEADGSQHGDNPNDARRTAWLEAHGWCVLRFWDNEVLTNTEGVIEVVLAVLRERETLTLPRLRRGPLPLPQCGRGDPLRAGEPTR
jgi:very-short-patch-repair endonuclease